MSTNMPTGLDSFTNPTSGEATNSPSHASQHANANDPILAMEKLLVGPFAYNVMGYGATGNGATDDTTAIQDAINDAQTAGGGIVLFPSGNYLISSSLTVASPGVVLKGVNEFVDWVDPNVGSTIKVASTMTNPLVKLEHSATGVNGIGFTTTSGSASVDAINIPGTNGSNVSDVTVKNVLINSLGGVSGSYVTRSLFEDVVVQAWRGLYGFSFTHPSILFFNRCNSSPFGTGTASTYLYDFFAQNGVTLNYNACEANGQPYYSFYMDTVDDSECWDLECNGATQDLVHITGGGNWSFGQSFFQASSVNNIYLLNTNTIRVTASTFGQFTNSAVVMDGGSGFTTDVALTANDIAWASASVAPIIDMTGPVWNVVVNGNTFTGNNTNPTWIRDNSTHAGHYTAAVGNAFNRALTSATASVTASVAGTLIAEENAGYNPTGPQTPPGVPSTNTALTNPFPFASQVYITAAVAAACGVSIGGTSAASVPANGIGSFRVGSGSTITLSYATAPTWTWFGS